MPRTRRRPGETGTRQAIIAAARALFGRDGYDRATFRAIAHTAGVDPRLVQHFFGSKHQLFIAAMELPLDPTTLIGPVAAPGINGLGERLVRMFISLWDSPQGQHLPGILRSVVGHDVAAKMMREFFTHAILRQVAASLEIDHPQCRASLVASQLFGLALVRYVVQLEPVASASVDELVSWVGPNLQRYFIAELESSGRPREANEPGAEPQGAGVARRRRA